MTTDTTRNGFTAAALAVPQVATVDSVLGAAPVQIEGTLTDGRHYYFRSRGQVAALGVGTAADDAVHASMGWPADGVGTSRVIRDDTDPFGAGCIDPGEAGTLLADMLTELLATEKP